MSRGSGRFAWVVCLGLGLVALSHSAALQFLPLQSTSPIRTNCPALPKPLSSSVMQCWKTTNDVKEHLLQKMGVARCKSCLSIEPNLPYIDYGLRLGSLVNNLRCLCKLQSDSIFKDNLKLSDVLFITTDNLNKIDKIVNEIQSKPLICTNTARVEFSKCADHMSQVMDSVKIKDKDKVYQLGYQYVAELQSYLEKLYLSELGKNSA